ncbi:type II toxin-antitoxin system PemK/MazF family toxin [Boseaceae bacterium BT-24-1]|nr:type II toxin-antitoxin system PemK/MazF family toxin [Boseaceae bacterium BT-24-1]
MSRGDVVVVAAAGDNGKPRPAVVVQTDAIPAAHPSVVICQMTSTLVDASDLRVTIEPSAENGLRGRSQVMIDKPVTLMRSRISGSIGRLNAAEMARVTAGLAFVIGVAD